MTTGWCLSRQARISYQALLPVRWSGSAAQSPIVSPYLSSLDPDQNVGLVCQLSIGGSSQFFFALSAEAVYSVVHFGFGGNK